MDVNLVEARSYLNVVKELMGQPSLERQMYAAVATILKYLESQQPQETSESNSSPDTGTQAETSDTSRISLRWSCLASQAGSRLPYLQLGILDWLNSVSLLGNVQEVEIGVILTPKAATPPDGSPSPSTVEATPAASGHAGELWLARSSPDTGSEEGD